MTKKSNNQGRAYELICLHTLYDKVAKIRPVEIIVNSSYNAAEIAWQTLTPAEQALYTLSAQSTIHTIFALEPNIIEKSENILRLYIQTDKHGEEADVRDIIIERKDIRWEIDLSIKHNHMAVKHSRLSKDIDFGKKWYDKLCSKKYWERVNPIFEMLAKEKEKDTLFEELPSKEDQVYMPLLRAFMEEISQQVHEDPTIPKKLVAYLLSKFDFYKVISIDAKRLTTIQAFNMYGTLNQPSSISKPEISIPRIALPNELLYIDMKKNSKTTAILCFDNGWQFSFRIHNAEKKVNTSLKFDIQLVGMPTETNNKFTNKW